MIFQILYNPEVSGGSVVTELCKKLTGVAMRTADKLDSTEPINSARLQHGEAA